MLYAFRISGLNYGETVEVCTSDVETSVRPGEVPDFKWQS